jgi:hypothetical protein
MAGSRREHGRPRREDARPGRQRTTFEERIEAAQTPRLQLSIAFDFLRMRMSQADQVTQARVAAQAIRFLVGLANRIKKAPGEGSR